MGLQRVSMLQPEIEGMELLGLVGEGTCGSIFIARTLEGFEPVLPDTKWYAVRVFNAISINRHLIENMLRRLQNGTYPNSVVPIAWRESKQGSRCMIMPMLADVDEEKLTIAINCLQDRLVQYPENDAWPVIGKLALALGDMHRRKIPHGNVKPGNIFFKDNGNFYLTDFAMGQMPGVGMLPRPEALLYAPPEQITNPNGYEDGMGYGWDNYAFGIIAFRLLTGKYPLCEATAHVIAPGSHPGDASSQDSALPIISSPCEMLDLESWSREPSDVLERKKRGVIQQCLSLNPEDRYSDMNEVLAVWEDIEEDTMAAEQKAILLRRSRRNKLVTVSALMLASACALVLVYVLGESVIKDISHYTVINDLSKKIALSELESKNAEAIISNAQSVKRNYEAQKNALNAQATATTTSLRKQLNAISLTNDHLVEWIMRITNKEVPELKAPDPASKVIADELRELLKLIENDKQAAAVRAATLMQLAEFEIHGDKPAAADALIDQAEKAWAELEKHQDEGLAARVARGRLACLLQAFDSEDTVLANRILPKARKNIDKISSGDADEVRRLNAAMQIVDGSLILDSQPAQALQHFKLALQDLEGLHQALPDHIVMRSRISHYAIKTAAIAESLELLDDAAKLRGTAATHLRSILESNPDLEMAKVDLARLEIISAESDMRSGDDAGGAARLQTAEKLLAELPADDISPNGVSMQTATAMGLRSVLLRDQNRRTDAIKLLDNAISIAKKIVEAHPEAQEPLYRLAIFHWQKAGLSGDAGKSTEKLTHGKQAADLMQGLLSTNANQKEVALRRSLAYLYGDLGKTAQSKGLKSEAISFFRRATIMWQSLLDVHEKNIEYLDGLKWSRSRYRQVGGR